MRARLPDLILGALILCLLLPACAGRGAEVEGIELLRWEVVPAAAFPGPLYPHGPYALHGEVTNTGGSARSVPLLFEADHPDEGEYSIMIGDLRPGEVRPFAVGVRHPDGYVYRGTGWAPHIEFDRS